MYEYIVLRNSVERAKELQWTKGGRQRTRILQDWQSESQALRIGFSTALRFQFLNKKYVEHAIWCQWYVTQKFLPRKSVGNSNKFRVVGSTFEESKPLVSVDNNRNSGPDYLNLIIYCFLFSIKQMRQTLLWKHTSETMYHSPSPNAAAKVGDHVLPHCPPPPPLRRDNYLVYFDRETDYTRDSPMTREELERIQNCMLSSNLPSSPRLPSQSRPKLPSMSIPYVESGIKRRFCNGREECNQIRVHHANENVMNGFFLLSPGVSAANSRNIVDGLPLIQRLKPRPSAFSEIPNQFQPQWPTIKRRRRSSHLDDPCHCRLSFPGAA